MAGCTLKLNYRKGLQALILLTFPFNLLLSMPSLWKTSSLKNGQQKAAITVFPQTLPPKPIIEQLPPLNFHLVEALTAHLSEPMRREVALGRIKTSTAIALPFPYKRRVLEHTHHRPRFRQSSAGLVDPLILSTPSALSTVCRAVGWIGLVGTVGFDIAHYRIRILAAGQGAKRKAPVTLRLAFRCSGRSAAQFDTLGSEQHVNLVAGTHAGKPLWPVNVFVQVLNHNEVRCCPFMVVKPRYPHHA